MPRNYQRKKNNPYLLPHNLYMRVLYIVKDYDRLKDEYHAILDSGAAAGVVNANTGGAPLTPTEDKAIRLALISDELHAIEQALMMIPDEYRQGVKHNVMYGAWYPGDADERTYRRWKQCFINQVARRLKFL